jgi:hypothetical protein
MPRKTVKFTYEGSSKFLKFVFLMGLIPYKIGSFIFPFSILAIFPVYILEFSEAVKGLVILAIVGSLIFMIFGRILAGIAQFLNWADRGSVNSKIFKKI